MNSRIYQDRAFRDQLIKVPYDQNGVFGKLLKEVAAFNGYYSPGSAATANKNNTSCMVMKKIKGVPLSDLGHNLPGDVVEAVNYSPQKERASNTKQPPK